MAGRFFSSIKKAAVSFWRWPYRNYSLIALFFLVWVCFFSANNLGTQIRIRRENRELKKLKRFYEREIRENEALIEKFRSDPEFVETYGRETYLMKADNEDIFLFSEDGGVEAK